MKYHAVFVTICQYIKKGYGVDIEPTSHITQNTKCVKVYWS